MALYEEYSGFVHQLMYKADGKQIGLGDICLGLAGELGEAIEAFDLAFMASDADVPRAISSVAEEVGDFFWYVQAMANRVGSQPFHNFERSNKGIAVPVGAVCDAVKKHLWHGKPLDVVKIEHNLNLAVGAATKILGSCCLSMDAVILGNMQKLNRRYPTGFVEGGGVR